MKNGENTYENMYRQKKISYVCIKVNWLKKWKEQSFLSLKGKISTVLHTRVGPLNIYKKSERQIM